jgi:hypothetical protein
VTTNVLALALRLNCPWRWTISVRRRLLTGVEHRHLRRVGYMSASMHPPIQASLICYLRSRHECPAEVFARFFKLLEAIDSCRLTTRSSEWARCSFGGVMVEKLIEIKRMRQHPERSPSSLVDWKCTHTSIFALTCTLGTGKSLTFVRFKSLLAETQQ